MKSQTVIGITGYGCYVPRFRLERAAIARAWGTPQAPGERAVANYDEDSMTLAAEAAFDCLDRGRSLPDGLLFATTSAPYGEKQVAGFLATVCDLPRRVWTADFGGSSRAGLSATLAAWHAVAAGRRSDVLVAAADVRLAEPQGELEGWFGDAAAAVRLGCEGVVAECVDQASVSEEFTHYWRTDDSRFVQVASGKFSNTFGYARDLSEAIGVVLERQGLSPDRIARLALASPDARAAADLAKQAGFDPKRQLVTPPYQAIGSAGVADPLLALVAALESARAGDLIVAGAYGEGADALLLRVTEENQRRRQGPALADHVNAKTLLPTYEKYLKFRRLVPADEAGEAVSNVLEYKELKQDIRLYGSRCAKCGLVQYPMARVCIGCKGRETLAEHKLCRKGKVFTFTIDHLIANLELPLPMVVVDLDEGGRLYLQATDALETEVRVGAPAVLTFRRIHDGGGNHNYYWKARPPRWTD